MSVTSRGREGNNHSGITTERVDLSADGRFVVFDSEATNLVRGDDNANAEVLLRDRLTGTTELISRDIDGNPERAEAAISGDGRFVAFISSGQNLVAGHPEFDLTIMSTCSTGRRKRWSVSTSTQMGSLVRVRPFT